MDKKTQLVRTRYIVSVQQQIVSAPRVLWLMALVVVLLLVYLPTLQTIPNGSEHYYMIDVGETQIVLNRWGTLHATGYPLYVISGNILVSLLRALGLSPATTPGTVSLLWLLLALALLAALIVKVLEPTPSPIPQNEANRRRLGLGWGQKQLIALAAVLLLGLTRTVWIHGVIAEIYSLGLLILVLLLKLALWPAPIRGRLYWLALVGGIGVFHHRALAMVAPALVAAVWPELVSTPPNASPKQRLVTLVRRVILCLLLGLIGFLPYLYLPLRANTGAAWVYGQPGTWSGFWDQFFGREAARFIGAPSSFDALLANISTVNQILITDLTLPGLIAGMAGLLLALRQHAHRRTALMLLISGLTAYGFHVLLYTDILSALILPILVSIAFGWAFLLVVIIELVGTRYIVSLLTVVVLSFAVYLFSQNQPFISSLTSDPTGLETIALAQSAPPNSALMLAWGPRYFAASFAQDVQGELANVQLVDHRADYAALLQRGQTLVTPDYTFYNQPVSWWEARLGARVYLSAAAPHLVQIKTEPELAVTLPEAAIGIQGQAVDCTADALQLRVEWVVAQVPARDLSVFVHLLDAGGNVIAQADQAAPVYGWRPLTTWTAGEVVRDIYPLPRLTDAALIRYGLYRQAETGEFVNEVEYETPVECGE